eukprot:366575-Chlamydomonas_euryale.AAC.1
MSHAHVQLVGITEVESHTCDTNECGSRTWCRIRYFGSNAIQDGFDTWRASIAAMRRLPTSLAPCDRLSALHLWKCGVYTCNIVSAASLGAAGGRFAHLRPATSTPTSGTPSAGCHVALSPCAAPKDGGMRRPCCSKLGAIELVNFSAAWCCRTAGNLATVRKRVAGRTLPALRWSLTALAVYL